MGTCESCKHWSEHDDDMNDTMARLGKPRDGTCLAISHGDDERAFLWGTGMVGGTQYLRTRSDFGCVLWEAKDG